MNDHLLAKVGQYAIICDEADRVLLLQRARSKTWCLPGGRLDKLDRDPKKALAREIKEELNLLVTDLTPVDVSIIQDKYQTKYCVYFLVQIKDINKLKISPEHLKFKWVNRKTLKGMILEDKKIKEFIF